MELTPAIIYWVLQVDCIKAAMIIFGFITVSVSIVALTEVCKVRGYIIFSIIGVISFLILISGIFCPSSKTICAMYIIPKIGNKEAINRISQNTSGIYKLGIEALKDLLIDKVEE